MAGRRFVVEREVVRQSGAVTSGWFRCRPGQPGFDGGSVDRPIVVFPRTAVVIRHDDRGEVVADPTVAMFYNRGDHYHRRPIDPIGDRCEWLSVPDEWWEEVCSTVDPAHQASDARSGDGRVFRRDHGPAPTAAYLHQRRLTSGIRRGAASVLGVEEGVLAVLRDVLGAAAAGDSHGPRGRRPSTRAHRRRLVEDTLELLAATYPSADGLADVAASVGASPYHLSRVFRAHTGTTIHQHRTQLRLRASLERLPDVDLATVAADLGFAHHSHFSATFRRTFGAAPSQVRSILTA